jgi:hypothetical protein
MATINGGDSALDAVKEKLQQSIKACASLEEAAQQVADGLYGEFAESIVLTRLYATAPYDTLPAVRQAFVSKLAAAKGVAPLLKKDTVVLSLVGTHGEKPAWNRSLLSQGHLGIPLVSVEFIEAIPMVSRLLKELGVPLDWLTGTGPQVETRNMGKLVGLFYVPDAETGVDQLGRKVISAQDFVAAHRVKTVFGFGSGYMSGRSILAGIIFSRETLEKRLVQRFSSLALMVTSGTASLVVTGKVFAA